MNKEERDLNFEKLFKMYAEKWWLILLAAVVCAALLGGYMGMSSGEQYYQVDSKVLIANAEIPETQGIYETQNGIQRDIFLNFVSSEMLFEETGKKLSFEIKPEELSRCITHSTEDDTAVVGISVRHTDRVKAWEIATTFLETAKSYMEQHLGVTSFHFLVLDAKETTIAPEDEFVKSAVIGAVAGAFLMIVALFVYFIADKKIYDEEDVTYYLGIDCLGTVSVSDDKSVSFATSQMLLRFPRMKIVGLCGFYENDCAVCEKLADAMSEKSRKVLLVSRGAADSEIKNVTASLDKLEYSDRYAVLDKLDTFKNSYDITVLALTGKDIYDEQLEMLAAADTALMLVAKGREKYPELALIQSKFSGCNVAFNDSIIYKK